MRLRNLASCVSAALVPAQWLPAKRSLVAQADSGGPVSFQLDGWADNRFGAYNGEKLIVEDSVPITTVMSFNCETARFPWPVLRHARSW